MLWRFYFSLYKKALGRPLASEKKILYSLTDSEQAEGEGGTGEKKKLFRLLRPEYVYGVTGIYTPLPFPYKM